MAETAERSLAALMFTDIVGYSALTQKNEPLALELLEAHHQLLRPIFPQFGGREVKTIGDAFLVEFSSALEATRCAIELQRTLALRNATAPPEKRIQIRIGIHVGDVVHQNGDVFGDAVNIASRMEPLARPGGVCVSEDVARQIQNKIAEPIRPIGKNDLKNIALPVEVYEIALPWLERAEARAAPAKATSIAQRKGRERLAWIALAVSLAIIAAVSTVLYLRREPVAVPHVQFQVFTPGTGASLQFAVSPDGKHLAAIATTPSGAMLWIRSFESLEEKEVPGTTGANGPFWSADSRSVAFFAQGKLQRVDLAGGPAQTLCEVTMPRGGTWNRDGVIVFAPAADGPLYRVSASGGSPTSLTTLDPSRQEVAHLFPSFLPDGEHFLYLARSRDEENSAIYAGSLHSQETKRLVNTNLRAAFAPPDFLLFMSETTLLAQKLDVAHLELVGEPFPVASEVGSNPATGVTGFVASDTGLLAYRQIPPGRQLVWFDRAGRQLGAVGEPGLYTNTIALSPDERKVAFARTDTDAGNQDIWVLEIARGITSRLTFDPSVDMGPVWSPDGTRIVFTSEQDGPRTLYQKPASGTGQPEQLLKPGNGRQATDWSRDGRYIAYQEADPQTRSDIWVLPLFGDRKPIAFLKTDFAEGVAHFSPDSRWIAYGSEETGRTEIYVQPFPASGDKRWQISNSGGRNARWRGDGKELFYVDPEQRLMAVPIQSGASFFEPGTPRVLFQVRMNTPNIFYDPTGDGQRFLIILDPESSLMPINIVLNWTAGLKKQ